MKLLIFFVSILLVNTLWANVYKWKDSQGMVHYSEHPPSSRTESVQTIGDNESNQNIDTDFLTTSQLKKLLVISRDLKTKAIDCYSIASKTRRNNNYCIKYMNKMSNKNFVDVLQNMSKNSSRFNPDQQLIWTEISNNIRNAEKQWSKATSLFRH